MESCWGWESKSCQSQLLKCQLLCQWTSAEAEQGLKQATERATELEVLLEALFNSDRSTELITIGLVFVRLGSSSTYIERAADFVCYSIDVTAITTRVRSRSRSRSSLHHLP